jgi:hypothetical protein
LRSRVGSLRDSRRLLEDIGGDAVGRLDFGQTFGRRGRIGDAECAVCFLHDHSAVIATRDEPRADEFFRGEVLALENEFRDVVRVGLGFQVHGVVLRFVC